MTVWRKTSLLGPLAAACALLAAPSFAAPGTPAAPEAPVFKIYLEHTGIYRVGFEDLAAAGLADEGLASAGVGLTGGGEPVPIWLEDGGDGVFGPGDWIELWGEHHSCSLSASPSCE